MSELKETYNRIAKDWHEDHQSDTWSMEGTDVFASFLPPGASVLDAGCGSGIKARHLAQKGFRVTGIDFAEQMIAIARTEVPEAGFFVMDMKDVAQLNEKFDGIFLQAVLLHVPKNEAEGILETLSEAIKPGGYFYVAVKERRGQGPEEEVRREEDYGYPYERFFSYFTLQELLGYFDGLGFQIRYQNVSLSGKTNWIQVIAQKPA